MLLRPLLLGLILIFPLEAKPAPPLMTPAMQKTLFDALDLSGDKFKAVREALAKHDYPAAQHALADYYRARTDVPWPLDNPKQGTEPAKSSKKSDPDKIAEGTLVGGLVNLPHTFPGNQIDWLYNLTLVTPGVPHNLEWQWQLCRMSFWPTLGRAYRETGNEKYAQAWAEQFRSFVAQNPVPTESRNKPSSAWRTIECGIRMSHSWPTSFYSFLHSPAFTDEDLALYLYYSLGHARYLEKFCTHGNWLTMEMSGLYCIGAVLPEFKEAHDWRMFAAGKLYAQEKEQFLPDGAQYELSPGYHNVAVSNIMNIPRLARQMGRLDELPAGYVNGMEKAFAYDLLLMTPDRSLPRFNDSWPVDVPGTLQKALDYYPSRADFQWITSDGREGQPPDETSHAFPWAGFYVMRSGWERDANYGVLRAGPLGHAHCQQDKLDFLAWAYGRELLFSSGGGSYEESPYRQFATSAFGHNCVIVDGKGQKQQTKDLDANVSKAPIDARWQSTPDHDFAEGVYDQGYGTEDNRIATQTRSVLFVKPDLFFVVDTLKPNDKASHTYEARWQLLTTSTQIDPVTKTLVTTDQDKPNLAIVPVLREGMEQRAVSAQTKPELLGWDVRKDLTPEYVPATTLLQSRKGTGTKYFMTLFLPLKAGVSNPVKSVEKTGPEKGRVTLTDGRKLAFTVSPGKTGKIGIDVRETLADGTAGRHVNVAGK